MANVSDHSTMAPSNEVAPSMPCEPTAGGHSIEGAIIIANRLLGRETWYIFITMVITATCDYHEDIRQTDTWNGLLAQRDESSLKALIGRNFGRWETWQERLAED